uniref:lipid droplet-associated hydrolase isoform X2 n=1 Tax=Epinephelus lanceolatus TaxID=310571 RepID=UPI001446BAB6|nr:lipid droplet-associated hydrolase isoform X2 [Epinephelus lanceolatus]
MQTLHSMFGYRHPVWAVSHAGHCAPPDSMDMVEDASSAVEGDVFGLNGQIEHKLAFLRKHVPRETSLVLVGHSIGCYIILDMMKRNPELKIIKAIMLFPTIERMAQTPQGKVMTPVLCHLRYVAYLPLFLLSLLPEGFKACLTKLVLRVIRSMDHTVVQPTVGLLSGDCAANAMYMGGQEMKKVLERDNMTIEKNLEKRRIKSAPRSLSHHRGSYSSHETAKDPARSQRGSTTGLPGPHHRGTRNSSSYFIMELQTTGALFNIIMTSSRTFHEEISDCVIKDSIMPLSWMQEEK